MQPVSDSALVARRDFLAAVWLGAGSVALGNRRAVSAPAGEANAVSSRALAVAIDRALAAHPLVYPRELVEKCTATAIAEIKACPPDPAVVKKLAALPNNTWLEMNEPESKGTPENHHSFPRGRGEGSATYDGTTRGVVCFGGCGAPDYSCDLWVYKTGANRWFEVWPNIPRKLFLKLAERPKDRPPPGCTLGLTYAEETGCVYRFTCANAGEDSPNVWETNFLSGKWQKVGRDATVGEGGVRIVADPVLNGLLAVPSSGPRFFSFRTKEWSALPGPGPKTSPCSALTYLGKHRCALLVGGSPAQARTAYEGKPRQVETWLFHSGARRWEQVKTTMGPEWYYRAGITYDSLNDVAILGGWKTNSPGDGPDVLPGLWIFDPNKKEWHFERPATGMRGRCEYFAYDPEYNAVVAAGNGHGTWVYRYRQAP